ncbi:hypothetical protein ECARS42123_2928, partial [Escherichia coli ARS4.2123]
MSVYYVWQCVIITHCKAPFYR